MTEQKESNVELMVGTTGKMNYAVLHKTDTHQLGITILLSAYDPATTFLGYRLRSAPRPDKNVVDMDNPNIVKCHDAYPMFQFEKKNSSRASVIGGMMINRGLGLQNPEIKSYLVEQGYVRALVAGLNARLEGQMIDELAIRKWITDRYFEEIDKLGEFGLIAHEPTPEIGDLFAPMGQVSKEYKAFAKAALEEAKKPKHMKLVSSTSDTPKSDAPEAEGQVEVKAKPHLHSLNMNVPMPGEKYLPSQHQDK